MGWRLKDNWEPVWWEPVLWAGSVWTFSATLHNLAPGVVTGARLVMNGETFPVAMDHTRLAVRLSVEDVARIPRGCMAQLFLDTEQGSVLWLHGRVSRGGE